jgi:hypothetical protein
MNEDVIKAEMRLFALETITCQLWAMTLLQEPPDIATKIHSVWLGRAKNHAFPGVDDPAVSDLYSAEFEAAMRRLVEMQKSHLRKGGR